MRRLTMDAGQKVYLILNNLKTQHGKKVTEWFTNHEEEIAVIYLPAYYPAINPDEYLNRDLKGRVYSDAPAVTESDLNHKTQSFMGILAKRLHRVQIYYRHPMLPMRGENIQVCDCRMNNVL